MKAILLCRVSTDRQEIDTQRNELIEMAVSDGYSRDELVIIEGVGASAIKLNEIYMREVDELFNTINNDTTINAVYAWEISRIGRNEEMLFKIKNFMVSHGVNIIIKNPSLRLLNSDGSVNNGVELAFSLYATMSKQEFELKKERFKRSKERNKREGRWNGGFVKFGYAVDDTNHYIVDEDTGNVVRQIFTMYLEEGATCRSIFNHFHALGYFPDNVRVIDDMQRISKMLKDRAYLGEGIYPRIIDDELFEKVNAKKATHHQRHVSSNDYLCKSILFDVETGLRYGAYIGACKYATNIKGKKRTLSMNVMDDLVCHVTHSWYLQIVAESDDVNRSRMKALIAENNKKIENVSKQIDEIHEKIDRVMAMHIEHPRFMTKEKMEKEMAVYEKNMREKEIQIAKWKNEIADSERLLSEGGDEGFYIYSLREFDELPLPKQYEIVRQTIKRIDAEFLSEGRYHLLFTSMLGETMEYMYERQSNKVAIINSMGMNITPILRIGRKRGKHNRKKYKKD